MMISLQRNAHRDCWRIWRAQRCHSATGYIYTYGRSATPRRMQEEMIAEIEHTRPEYVVYVHSPTTRGLDKGSDDHILTWAE